MIWLRRVGVVLAGAMVLAIAAWLFRVPIAETLIGLYFQEQGVASDVTVERLDWSGLTARVVLGAADAPAFSADALDVTFNPDRWLPQVVAVRVVRPVVRVRIGRNGTIEIPELQAWIERRVAAAGGRSQFVSADLAVDLQDLRAIVATPAGPIALGGDAQMTRGALTSLDMTAQPTVLSRAGDALRVDGLRLTARASATGLSVAAQFAGSLRAGRGPHALYADGVRIALTAAGIRWTKGGEAAIDTAHLQLAAQDVAAGDAQLLAPETSATVSNVRASSAGGRWTVQAQFQARATAQTMPAEMRSLFLKIPGAGLNRALGDAVAAAAQTMTLAMSGDVHGGSDGAFGVTLSAPATLEGRNHALLRIGALSLEKTATTLEGAVDAQLGGDGLPSVSFVSRHFAWVPETHRFAADASLRAHFDTGMLQDADIDAAGTAAQDAGRFTFALGPCAQLRVGAVRSGRKAMLRRLAGTVCTKPGTPLFATGRSGWTIAAQAKALAADAPLAKARLSGGGGEFALGARDGRLAGAFRLANARVADAANPARFHPLGGSVSGTVAGNRIRGEALLASGRVRIARVTFTHDLNSGAGEARIAARDLRFAPKALQPADLSPLLVQIRNASGQASFTGTVAWTRRTLSSGGVLDIPQLDFSTPLGPAHAFHSTIAFRSLLPPVTVDGQRLDIAKIDWTLPLTDTRASVTMAPDAVHVVSAKTDVADGAVTMDGLTVTFGGGAVIHGTARLENIDLAQIVAATNIGDKVKVEGRVKGELPFTSGPEGFRIVRGHVESVGPGRLAINPALWTKDTAAVNGVQNFAYQALEHLAVDSMTADVDSVANGRLRIVFHVKGHSDPPRPQEARVGLFDLLRGTAFDKPVPLPSGTPIDLTLDTSLNFDELLKSYQSAWSESLAATPPGGGRTR